MIQRLATLLFLLCLTSSIFAQTPVQSYFEWTDLPFSKTELAERRAKLIQPGMIFTVEPWYYNHDEQISVFTEDVILITKEGCEVLSKSLPRTPEGLEKLMK